MRFFFAQDKNQKKRFTFCAVEEDIFLDRSDLIGRSYFHTQTLDGESSRQIQQQTKTDTSAIHRAPVTDECWLDETGSNRKLTI